MQLYLDSYGAFLGVRNGMFYVKPRYGEGQALPLRQVKAIFLCRGVRVSTDALELAIRSGIPVLLTDGIGRPLGQVWSGQFGSIATIRKNQALFSLSLPGLYYVAGLLRRRAEGQLKMLARLKEQYRAPAEGWERGVEVIQGIIERHKKVKEMRDREALSKPSAAGKAPLPATIFSCWPPPCRPPTPSTAAASGPPTTLSTPC